MKARLPKFDVVSIEDLSNRDLERIFALADEFSLALEGSQTVQLANGLIMATLFYEPSTRTRLSFESAMHRLGGSVISSADMQASSAAKGETLADTVRVVSAYADLIVLRHPRDGAARVAAEYAPCPVLNAGDGSREHPTQTLCDLYILRKKKGRLKGLTVALCGDLKFGRTVHSLIYALARFGANIVTVPNRGMDVPDFVLERIAAERGYNFSSVTMNELKTFAGGLDAMYLTPSGPHQMALFTGEMPLEPAAAGAGPAALDAFYVTRLQRERLGKEEGENQEPYFQFDARALKGSRAQEAVVMHPLPRTDELAYELDNDPRAIYFEQAAAGVPVRMGLIAWMIERSETLPLAVNGGAAVLKFRPEGTPRCVNANCITRHETSYLTPRYRLAARIDRSALAVRCDYCERELRIEFVGNSRSRRYYRFDENLYGYVRRWIEEGTAVAFESVKQAEEANYEPYRRGPQREIMNAAEIAAAAESIADQLIRELPDLSLVGLAGVISRGAVLAMRLRELIREKTGVRLPCAAIEVHSGADAVHALDGSEKFEVEGRTIVLVDDVINSGWTVQRTMAALWKLGRPASVKLAVLIDRGHRAVPIRPNYVGKNIPTQRAEHVQVRLTDAAAPAGGEHADRVVVFSLVESLKGVAEQP